MADAKLNYTVSEINKKLDRIEISEGNTIDLTLDEVDRRLSGRLNKVETELDLDSEGNFSRIKNIETELDFYKGDNGEYHSRIDDIDEAIQQITDTIGEESGSENLSILGRISQLEDGKLNILKNTEKKRLQVYAQTTDNQTTLIDVTIRDMGQNSIVQRSEGGYVYANDYMLVNYYGQNQHFSISNYIEELNAELDDLAGTAGVMMETIGIDSSGGSAGENSIMERLATTEDYVEILKTELEYTPTSGPRLERIDEIENRITNIEGATGLSSFMFKATLQDSSGDPEFTIKTPKDFRSNWYKYRVLLTPEPLVTGEPNGGDLLSFVRQELVSNESGSFSFHYTLTNGVVTYCAGMNPTTEEQNVTFKLQTTQD